MRDDIDGLLAQADEYIQANPVLLDDTWALVAALANALRATEARADEQQGMTGASQALARHFERLCKEAHDMTTETLARAEAAERERDVFRTNLGRTEEDLADESARAEGHKQRADRAEADLARVTGLYRDLLIEVQVEHVGIDFARQQIARADRAEARVAELEGALREWLRLDAYPHTEPNQAEVAELTRRALGEEPS